MPRKDHKSTDLDFLFKGFWTGMKYVGRYAVPLEDAIILIDGKDFDGEESSRVAAGAFVVLDLIQIGKLVKVVKAGAKVATTAGKATRKYFIDHSKEAGKEVIIEFATQLMVNFLIEAYHPNNKGAEVSVVLAKAFKKIDLGDIIFAASQGINVNSRITDEQVNCMYAVFKNFESYKDGKKAMGYTIQDCFFQAIVNIGYNRTSKTKFFSELKKAINEQRNDDIIMDYLSRKISKETRDKFLKEIIQKMITQKPNENEEK